MAVKTKAVGVRFPLELIERIERYQNDQGVNFTEALVKLVEMGLGGDEDETIKVSDDKLNERITTGIKRTLDLELDERITSLINNKLDIMFNERLTASVEQPLDVMLDKPDTKNILSDDLSNSESVAEVVQNIPTAAIEKVSGEISESYSFAEFRKLLGLPRADRNKTNGDIAIDFARSQGRGEWVMSRQLKFTKLTEDNNQNG
jgi:hypothetical protein